MNIPRWVKCQLIDRSVRVMFSVVKQRQTEKWIKLPLNCLNKPESGYVLQQNENSKQKFKAKFILIPRGCIIELQIEYNGTSGRKL